MSRRHRRARPPHPREGGGSEGGGPPLLGGWMREEERRDGTWLVRSVSGSAATKAYRCPGCNQEILPGVAHVVAWPADDGDSSAERRHWHTGCWGRGR